MNEMTSTGRCFDGRITGGLKGMFYDVSSLAGQWDESLILTDTDIDALLESAK